MASPPAAVAALLVAVDGWATPRIAGLALGKHMYLAGSLSPVVFDRYTDIQTFRYSFRQTLILWQILSYIHFHSAYITGVSPV